MCLHGPVTGRPRWVEGHESLLKLQGWDSKPRSSHCARAGSQESPLASPVARRQGLVAPRDDTIGQLCCQIQGVGELATNTCAGAQRRRTCSCDRRQLPGSHPAHPMRSQAHMPQGHRLCIQPTWLLPGAFEFIAFLPVWLAHMTLGRATRPCPATPSPAPALRACPRRGGGRSQALPSRSVRAGMDSVAYSVENVQTSVRHLTVVLRR
jgi:hypothetical protein